jgi:ATP-dependent helicase/DNAse subunit B
MSLHLTYGPPNSGRAGLIRRRLLAVLDRDPVLVVPTADDVYVFERELSQERAILGATVTNFGGLFRAVTATAGAPLGIELTPAQRLGAVAAAVEESRSGLGPLRSSARRPGFAHALMRLFDELQEAGREPADVEATAATLEGSAYLGDVATLFAGYARIRDGLSRVDAHDVSREAIRLLRESGEAWHGRPVFLYGFDDLTRNQLDLIAALAAVAGVTVALPYEDGNSALAARGALLASLRRIGVDSVTETKADPRNTDSPLLFGLERGFGAADPEPVAPDGTLTVLRSAGERGEAEALGAEVAKLIVAGVDPEEIAIVARDPGRRGPLLVAVLESYGVHTALDAEVGVATTSVGGALIALLEAELGSGEASDLLRYMRGPSGLPEGKVDWFERAVRRKRLRSTAAALDLWQSRTDELPEDLSALRGAGREPVAVARVVATVATAMAARALRRADGGDRASRSGAELEARAAGAIANALSERADLDGLAPEPGSLSRVLAAMTVRVWTGPATGRVRIGGPDRLRAVRFDHVFVASLQDGEFPRRESRVDPFLSESQRDQLGLPPRRDSEAEERYFFHASLALPRRRLFLSYRDSDENGAAEGRSPFLDDVRRLLEPPPGGERDSLEDELTHGRDLAQVVHRPANAPCEHELARSIASYGQGADAGRLLAGSGAPEESAARIAGSLARGAEAELATRAPGPLSNPTVLDRLAAVPAYGGTTLEGFDVCSYRWFVNHELRPEPLDPPPDPLVQGGIAHAALERLYREPPGADPLPRPASLAAWIGRARELVAEIAAARGLGKHPAERASVRRVEGLLSRFLVEEAERDGGFRPWLLEAGFGEAEETARPVLEVDDWALHGAIDRVDRDADGRALVIDYKLASSVSARAKLEEEAKLQLQLYLVAVAELWDAPTVGGIYHPLRASSLRRPRGLVLDEAAEALAPYKLSRTDVVDREGYEEALSEARDRAGAIVARMRGGDIRRDPGPRPGLRNHGVCPPHCELAPICRRDRAPVEAIEEEDER